MLMLRTISKTINLITKMAFMFNQPPRDSSLPTQSQTMLPYSINFLHDNKGSIRIPKQLGRGPGSGKGKTSGRGHKGHKSRAGGGVHVRFEGGQTPLTKRLPKYGRVLRKGAIQILTPVTLRNIDYFIKTKVIDPTKPITIKTLVDSGLVKDVKFGVKLLGKGFQKIDYPLNFEVTDASKPVIKKIQQTGGSVILVHRTPLKLKQHMYPSKYPLPLAQPITPWWKVKKLIRKQEDRGLSIKYNKPAWMQKTPIVKKQQRFVYPIPRVSNPQKVRTRKPKLFKKIDYDL